MSPNNNLLRAVLTAGTEPSCPVCGEPLFQSPRVDVCDACGYFDYYNDTLKAEYQEEKSDE